MPRTITVKGIGHVTAKPDTIVVKLTLRSFEKKYSKAMEIAADKIDVITKALSEAGFEKDSIKTRDFDVQADCHSVLDENDNYKRVFKGYLVIHELKIEFELDLKRLSDVLTAISECISQPELSITFTIKDVSAISEELLRSAAANARRKAEILCDAAGVKLGQLLSINYNWSELNVYSDTDYDGDELGSTPIDIEPDDIDVNDTAAFVWEIN